MATIDLTAPEVDLPKARELLHKALDLLERNDDAVPPSDARTLKACAAWAWALLKKEHDPTFPDSDDE